MTAPVFLIGIVIVAATGGVGAGASASSEQAGAAKPSSTAKSSPSDALPAAIKKAFTDAYPHAVIKNVSREKEDGRDQYEIESTDNGKGRDLIYLPDGTIVLVEDELSVAEFPAPVAAAIKTRYPKASITKRERVTITKGHQVQYEAVLTGAAVKEVTLMADGTWVSPKK